MIEIVLNAVTHREHPYADILEAEKKLLLDHHGELKLDLRDNSSYIH